MKQPNRIAPEPCYFLARYFDIESIKDKTSKFPHMMPTATQFAQQVGELGITNNDHIVVYDTAGFFSAPRVYWMFKVIKRSRSCCWVIFTTF